MTTTTVRDARAAYYEDNSFPADGGDSEMFVKLPVGPFRVWLPNLPPRRRAVKLHDLHHVVTGYETDWRGEFQISAWEVGAGCGRYWMAWLINAGGVAGGLLLCPAATFRAYARGRASDTLYHHVDNGPGFDACYDALLPEDMDALRRRLSVAQGAEPTTGDKLRAVGIGLLGAAAHVLPVVGTLLLAAWWLSS